jgi:threonine/homoserine/homoserine lactone efflux protein
VHASINVIWFSAMIILLSRLTGVARSGSFQRALKAVTGSVFIAFGIKLAMFRP